MSKSKGNVIDPLGLIEQYGADSLRFTLAAMAAQGRDLKLSTQRVEGYRNFATKIWNAARFAEINGCVRVADFDPKSVEDHAQRLDSGRGGQGGRRGFGRDQDLSLQRRRQRRLSLRLEHFLRLASRAGETSAAGRRRPGEGGNARGDRLRSRRDLEAAASLHALPHRGALGDQGRGGACAEGPPRAGALAAARRARKRGARRPRSAGSSSWFRRCARCAPR